MLLIIAKGIRGRLCHAIQQYAKANNKYMKGYDQNKKSLYLKYWDVNNLYCWVLWQKLPANNSDQIEDTFQFSEDFIKGYKGEVMKYIFSKFMFSILKNQMNYIIIYHFVLKE